jgi:hypothetical protein
MPFSTVNPNSTAAWAAQELHCADLGDRRLNQRLTTIVASLAAQPTVSVPQACRAWAATKATYRFWASDRVTPDAIRAAHYRSSLARCVSQATILAIQDTTTLDFTHHPATRDLGPIHGTPYQQGLHIHSVLTVTPDGVPLGLIHQQVWARDPTTTGKKHQRHQRATADKESQRWLTALAATQAGMPPHVQVVTIADREADIFDLFAHPRLPHSHLLIRAAYNRRVAHSTRHLWTHMRQVAVGGQVTIDVRRGDDHPARTATLTVRWTSLALAPPGHRKGHAKLPPVPLHGVLLEEESAPADCTPICWLLLTTLPVLTWEDAVRTVEWYSRRWLVERYHFVLKSGCRVEQLQLETFVRLERAIATYSIVAWRLLWLTYQARREPDAPCDTALTPAEWQVLYCMMQATPVPPTQPPCLHDAVQWIARLGGFLGRKGDGEPGVQVIWRGLQRLHDMAAIWSLFHPDAPYPPNLTYG